MATIFFKKSFALKEVTETFLALDETLNPSIIGIEDYECALEIHAQVVTKEDKMQFLQSAKSMVSKGVEFESYFHRAILKYCITLTWRCEK